jgi:hypothetical protein
VRTGVPSKVAGLPLPAGLRSGWKKAVAQLMPSALKLSSKLTVTSCGTRVALSPPGGLVERASSWCDSASGPSSAGVATHAGSAAATRTARAARTSAGFIGRAGCRGATFAGWPERLAVSARIVGASVCLFDPRGVRAAGRPARMV